MKLSVETLKSLIKDSYLDHRKENIRGLCPKCGQSEFGISLKENHRFGCFRSSKCGYKGNIFKLLQDLGRLHEFLRDQDSLYERKGVELLNKLESQELELHVSTIEPPIGFRRVFQDEYLDSRGFESYDRFVVGKTKIDSAFLKYVIFLIKEQGEIKGWVARHIWSKKQIDAYNEVNEKKIKRYRNSESDFSKLVEGWEQITEKTTTIILVEGLFDKESIDRKLELFEQEEIRCVCTFKCQLSPEQLAKIKIKGVNVTTFILFYDPDVFKKTLELGSDLELKYEKVLVVENNTEKDPGDMNSDEILTQLLERTFKVSELRTKVLPKKTLNL